MAVVSNSNPARTTPRRPACSLSSQNIFCNFIRSAAYCFVDAKKKKTKGNKAREVKAKKMEARDLESVIERDQDPDAETLEEIHRRYVRRVFGLCRYMLDSRENAEDATSEAFLKLQRSIESYDGSIPFPQWLL